MTPDAYSTGQFAVPPPFLSLLLSAAPLCFPGVGVLMGWWQSCLFTLLSCFHSGPLSTLFSGHSHRCFIFPPCLSALAGGAADPRMAGSPPVLVSPLSDLWDWLVLGFCLDPRAFSLPLPPSHHTPFHLPHLDMLCGTCTFISL